MIERRALLPFLLIASLLVVAPAAMARTHAKKSAPHAAAKSGKAKHADEAQPTKKTSGRQKAAAKRPTLVSPATFRASEELRPMAMQLMRHHSTAAYAAVESWARAHGGASGALAWLAAGAAHAQDNEAQAALADLANARGKLGVLEDYADYFAAKSYAQLNQSAQVLTTLKDFNFAADNSIFALDAAALYGDALLKAQRAGEAASLLEPLQNAARGDLTLELAKAYLATGQQAKAVELLRKLYYTMPLFAEAPEAGSMLAARNYRGNFAECKQRIALLMSANKWSVAASELPLLIDAAPTAEKANLQAELAVCLRHTQPQQGLQMLQEVRATGESEAERLYYLGDEARSREDGAAIEANLAKMRAAHASGYWMEQALLSAGNHHLLRHELAQAEQAYGEASQQRAQVEGSPASSLHWKSAWLAYRQGDYANAKRMFEEQVAYFPGGTEIPAALYWRARLAEQEGQTAMARAWLTKCAQRYGSYYYGVLAAERVSHIAQASGEERQDLLAHIPPVNELGERAMQTSAPANDLRAAKSRLLANAGMIDFAVRELQAAGGGKGANWATLSIAEIYASTDAPHRSISFLKRALPGYYAYSLQQLPRRYWELLFPLPYWQTIQARAAEEHLNPYLIASLMRQESEFNAGAVSRANAYGLMQLLPSVGRQMGHELKVAGGVPQLLQPETNIKLGTHYFSKLIAGYGGTAEYALAAYNAGENRVSDWRSANNFRDVPEFVESIPFTETREYVQAILRNAEIYRKMHPEARAGWTN